MGDHLRRRGPFHVNGETFPTLKDAAKRYKLPPNRVVYRLKRRWSLEEALGIVERPESKATGLSVTLEGKTYKSRAEASRALGLDPRIVHMRLKAERPIEQAFGIEDFDYSSKPKFLELAGKTFPSIAEACRHFGVDKYTVNARINRFGWSIEQALEIAPRPNFDVGVAGAIYMIESDVDERKYIGITMGPLEERWRGHLIQAFSDVKHNPKGLHFAVRQHGQERFKMRLLDTAENFAELQTKEVEYIKKYSTRAPNGFNLNSGGANNRSKGIKITVGGKTFESYAEACRHFKVPWERARGRIEAEWALEEVFELVPREDKFGPISVEVRGAVYPSINQAAAAFGLKGELVTSRMRSDWTLEQALEIEPSPVDTSVEYDGKRYPSLVELAEAYGIPRGTLYSRLSKGRPMEQALGLEPMSHEVEYEGKRYRSLRALAIAYGLEVQTLKHRLVVQKMPIKDALRKLTNRKKR